MSKQSFQLSNALRGMAMGLAEIVPGVSGGTIAFITGIYERLIGAIKSVDGQFFKLLGKLKIKDAFHHVDGSFLVSLLSGMVIGIVVAIFSVTYLLENYPPAVWAFFFGLIVASTIYILRQIKKWNVVTVLFIAVFSILAFCIVTLAPAEGSESFLYIYLAGTIAICALLLPGISGSFILLLLGMYKFITSTLKEVMMDFATDKILVMLVFGLGCLTGLAGFSRILAWTFKKYQVQTLAALSGFMIGSLWKIWPWRVPTQWMTESGEIQTNATHILPTSHEELKIIAEQNVLPGNYDLGPNLVFISIGAAIVGFALVFLIDRWSSRKS